MKISPLRAIKISSSDANAQNFAEILQPRISDMLYINFSHKKSNYCENGRQQSFVISPLKSKKFKVSDNFQA